MSSATAEGTPRPWTHMPTLTTTAPGKEKGCKGTALETKLALILLHACRGT